jgi:acyl dehydratase
MKIFRSYSEVSACVGQEVAVTDWITITQEQVNLFAQATGDHQWIHVDPERAKAGPFGAPIAHGFLTLSLIPQFFEAGLVIEGSRMGVNYGLNKVRFTAPVPVGSRLRAAFRLLGVDPAGRRAGGPRRHADDLARDGGARGQRQAGVCGRVAGAQLRRPGIEGQPPERLRRFPLLSNGCAIRQGGHRQCGGTALARRSLAWIACVPRTAFSSDAHVFGREA